MSDDRDRYRVDLTLADSLQMGAIGKQIQRMARKVPQLAPERSLVSVRVSFTEPVSRTTVTGPDKEGVRQLMNAVYEATGASVQASLVPRHPHLVADRRH